MVQQLIIGALYKHYSGKFYKTIGIFRHSESLENYVAYIAFGDNHEGQLGKNWIRPVDMFLEEVTIEGNVKVPRFEIIKQTKEMQ